MLESFFVINMTQSTTSQVTYTVHTSPQCMHQLIKITYTYLHGKVIVALLY